MEKEESNVIVLADYRKFRQYSFKHPSVYYKIKRMRDNTNGI